MIYLINALIIVGASTQVNPGPKSHIVRGILYGLIGLNILGWFLQ